MPTKEDKDRRGTTTKRPDPPSHSVSFSKRHASFDSPREVPLPSLSINQTAMRQATTPKDTHFGPVFDDDADWEVIASGASKLQKDKGREKAKHQAAAAPIAATQQAAAPPPSSFQSKAGKLKSQPQAQSGQQQGASTILPYSRPYSLPETHSYHGRSLVKGPTPSPPTTVDRTSSASLPLPMQIPFSTLPKARPNLPSPVQERSAAEAQLRPPMQPHSSSSSSSSSSSGSLPSAPGSRSTTPATSSSTQPSGTAPVYPPLRAAAPMAQPDLLTFTGSVASYRPPRTTYTPVPPTPPDGGGGATAMTRSPSLRSSSSSFPPPEPPVILPSLGDAPDAEAQVPQAVIPQPGTRASSASTRSSGASYEPFLSHAPPPVDSWIEVETTQAEYRLIVRLPGFKRDGITLATKKRRILHVVADSWENGGGHFERRISFGYDADLAQVRAEFDGELLRIIIPRRVPAAMLTQQPWGTPASVGR